MKTIDKIPTSKISRATKLVSTGAKVGVNYLKYYGDKLITGSVLLLSALGGFAKACSLMRPRKKYIQRRRPNRQRVRNIIDQCTDDVSLLP